MGGTVILLDTSSSMALPVGDRQRIDVLTDILKALPVTAARRVAFASVAMEIDGHALPRPGGDTALADALAFVAEMNPDRVIVISDGEPNDAEAALARGRQLGARNCRIETYFCGDEREHAAVAFLRALAWCSNDGIGATSIADLTQPEQIASELRLALTHAP